MAKQTSLIKINGKADGQSFYTSKNGGALMRSINKGMSARVKDAKEYANTRKNNAEFGACGDFAGAIIKPISLRWRFILSSIATGMLVKKLKELVKLDTAGKWGQRVVQLANFGEIRETLNSLSKNELPEQVAAVLNGGVQFNAAQNVVSLTSTGEISESDQLDYKAAGIDGMKIQVFNFIVDKPTFDASANAYTPAISRIQPIDALTANVEFTGTGTVDVFGDLDGSVSESPVDTASKLGGLLVVCLPFRKVGGAANILQEKCSAYIAPVVAGA